MAASVYKIDATGAAALNDTAVAAPGGTYQLASVTLNLSAAPTTSENYTITLDANAGAEYDVLLYSVDLSAASTTDLVWLPDGPIYLEGGDKVTVAWANTDLRTYGNQITLLRV